MEKTSLAEELIAAMGIREAFDAQYEAVSAFLVEKYKEAHNGVITPEEEQEFGAKIQNEKNAVWPEIERFCAEQFTESEIRECIDWVTGEKIKKLDMVHVKFAEQFRKSLERLGLKIGGGCGSGCGGCKNCG